MRTRKQLIVVAALGLTLTASAAVAAGPWPGLVANISTSDGGVRYTAKQVGSTTRVTATRVRDHRLLRAATVKGILGIPAVTLAGAAGGLSADGRTLVLSAAPSYDAPRAVSRFAILSTATLRGRLISLRGDFGYDALSPDAGTLYLIQHQSLNDARYLVRAYDVASGRLLRRAIADKTESDATMRGFPVARATSADGTWVYTLYRRADEKPFVHALNTVERYAVCVDLPRQVADESLWSASLELTDGGGRLIVQLPTDSTAFVIDTGMLRVVPT